MTLKCECGNEVILLSKKYDSDEKFDISPDYTGENVMIMCNKCEKEIIIG